MIINRRLVSASFASSRKRWEKKAAHLRIQEVESNQTNQKESDDISIK